VSYDLLQVSLDTIEKVIEDNASQQNGTVLGKIKRSIIHYSEECELGNLAHLAKGEGNIEANLIKDKQNIRNKELALAIGDWSSPNKGDDQKRQKYANYTLVTLHFLFIILLRFEQICLPMKMRQHHKTPINIPLW
jgi:hypothetical protein